MGRRSRFILVFSFLVALPTAARSQGMFLGKDQSGFGLQGMVGGSDDLEAVGAALTFTTQGTFDLGVAWARTETKEPGEFGNLESNDVTPFMAIAFTRPDTASAVGAEFRASYSFGRVTSDLDENKLGGNSELDTSVLLLGLAGYGELSLDQHFRLLPEAGVYYAWTRAKPEGAADSVSESDILAELALHLVFGKKDEGPKVVLSPMLQFIDGNQSWLTSLAIVFPKSNKPKTGWGS